jgi:hypothetical protein
MIERIKTTEDTEFHGWKKDFVSKLRRTVGTQLLRTPWLNSSEALNCYSALPHNFTGSVIRITNYQHYGFSLNTAMLRSKIPWICAIVMP